MIAEENYNIEADNIQEDSILLFQEPKISLADELYFDFSNGLWTGKKPPFQNVNVIRNTNFARFGIIDLSDVAVIEVEQRHFEKRKLLVGDIIIERSGGGPKQPVGRVVFFNLKNGDYSFSNFTSLIRSKNPNTIDPKFLFYNLLNFYHFGDIERYQAQTTGLRNLDFQKYKGAVSIPLLNITEQRAIARVLSTVQAAIAKQDELIQTTQAIKKALMHQLFTEGLNGEPTKETEIGPIPESWEVVPMKKVLIKSETRDPTRQPDLPFTYVDVSGVSNTLFKVADSTNLLGRDAPSRARKVIKTGDILFATVRPTLKRIALIEPQLNNQICSTAYCVLRPNVEKVNRLFLFHFLQTDNFIAEMAKIQRGASYPAVRDSDVKNGLIPLPTIEVQAKIGQILQTFYSKILDHTKHKQTLETLFRTLLHELMTGQRRLSA